MDQYKHTSIHMYMHVSRVRTFLQTGRRAYARMHMVGRACAHLSSDRKTSKSFTMPGWSPTSFKISISRLILLCKTRSDGRACCVYIVLIFTIRSVRLARMKGCAPTHVDSHERHHSTTKHKEISEKNVRAHTLTVKLANT